MKTKLMIMAMASLCSQFCAQGQSATNPAATFPRTASVSTIVMMMHEDNHPIFSYTAVDGRHGEELRGWWSGPEDLLHDQGKRFTFALNAFCIPNGKGWRVTGDEKTNAKYDVLQFTGTVVWSENSRVTISGNISSKIPGKILLVLMEIRDEHGQTNNEFPEIYFSPGETRIELTGTVVGRIKK